MPMLYRCDYLHGMLCREPCKALLGEEDTNVALHQSLALSGLNNTRSSQAEGPQQESAINKISAAVVYKDTTTSCTSTSMQAWHLDNQSWCVAFHYAPCTGYPQFTEILPTKRGEGGDYI